MARPPKHAEEALAAETQNLNTQTNRQSKVQPVVLAEPAKGRAVAWGKPTVHAPKSKSPRQALPPPASAKKRLTTFLASKFVGLAPDGPRTPAPVAEVPSQASRCFQFDFNSHTCGLIPVEAVMTATGKEGLFVWIDIDLNACADEMTTRQLLRSVGVEDKLAKDVIMRKMDTKYDSSINCLHLTLPNCQPNNNSRAWLRKDGRVDVLLQNRCCITVHYGRVAYMDQIWDACGYEFASFAKTPSFLFWMLWDRMIADFDACSSRAGDAVMDMQSKLVVGAEDSGGILAEFGNLSRDILLLRKIISPARNVLMDVAGRKTKYVSDASQPYLQAMVPRIDRIIGDIMVNREILSEALTLHMALGDRELNNTMKNLSHISTVFLPLTFLCGVEGMNFKFQPEHQWQYGYPAFWVVVCIIAFTVWLWMKRAGNRRKFSSPEPDVSEIV